MILAERISFGNGQQFFNPRGLTNFLYVLGDEGIIQVAFENGRIGYNGLGGITCKGSVHNSKLKQNNDGSARLTCSMYGYNISASVNVTLDKHSNIARAYIISNNYSERIIIYGKLYPYNGKYVKL